MKATLLLSSLLLVAAVGCGSQATVRQFDVPFETADDALRDLYPSGSGTVVAGATKSELRTVIASHLAGPQATIGRNELDNGKVTVRVREYDKMAKRTTEIVLKYLSDSRSEVSVQTSTASKAVLLPPRDMDYEQKQMHAIAAKLKK